MRVFFILISLLGYFASNAQSQQTVSLLFLGDVMGHDTQINSAYNEKTNSYNYEGCFKYISNIFDDADFTIANLEVTLAGPPFKGYPQFSSPDNLAIAMKNAGVDAMVTANNHCVDRRQQGLERTIDILDSLKIPRTGTFKNEDDRKSHNPMILEKDDMKIAILNYTYGTNGIPVAEPNIVNTLDKNIIQKDIEYTKTLKPDFIIAFVHWGLEYELKENATQRDFNQFFNDNGVNIVIGSHPHVVQPIYLNNNQFVVYSLGNFMSNQRTAPRDGGAMIRLELTKSEEKNYVSDAAYYLTWVYTPTVNGKKEFMVLPVNPFLSNAYFMDEKAHLRLNAYEKEAKDIYKSNLNVKEMKFDANLPGWQAQ